MAREAWARSREPRTTLSGGAGARPSRDQSMSFTVKLHPSGHRFEVESGETVLEAALRAGRSLAFGCANGSCGECRARIIAGEVDRVRFHDYALADAEKRAGVALLCSVAPGSDLVVESTEVSGAGDIPRQRVRAKVTRVEPASDEHAVVHFRIQRARVLRYLAGQRATVQFENAPPRESWLASCPCDAVNLRIHVRRDPEDPFAALVSGGLGRGARAIVEGPFGGFVLDDTSGRTLLFLAWDTGFAPVESLIEHAINLKIDAPIRLVRVVRGRGVPYRHNHCRAWADALDDFSYRVVETPDIDETWDALAARVIEAASGPSLGSGSDAILGSSPGPVSGSAPDPACRPGSGSQSRPALDSACDSSSGLLSEPALCPSSDRAPRFGDVDAYVAGLAEFTDACRRLLLENGVPEERLKTDAL